MSTFGGSGLIASRDSYGLKRKGHPGLREAWELARAALLITRDMPKDIATQIPVFGLASSEDYWLPFGNR